MYRREKSRKKGIKEKENKENVPEIHREGETRKMWKFIEREKQKRRKENLS